MGWAQRATAWLVGFFERIGYVRLRLMSNLAVLDVVNIR